MNKLSRFNGFGIEDEEQTVTTADGATDVTVNAEPPKDNAEEPTDPTATETPTDGEGGEETSETEETSDDDLEIKEDDSEEVAEEKEKKIKIEIEIAQEQIAQMSDAVSSLEAICSDMEKSLQRGGLNIAGRNIAKTSVNHIAKQFNIEQSTVSSLESYGYPLDDFHATRISIEGIVETVSNIIKTILEKLKKFKDWLFNSNKAREMKENNLKEKVKEKQEEYKAKPVEPNEKWYAKKEITLTSDQHKFFKELSGGHWKNDQNDFEVLNMIGVNAHKLLSDVLSGKMDETISIINKEHPERIQMIFTTSEKSNPADVMEYCNDQFNNLERLTKNSIFEAQKKIDTLHGHISDLDSKQWRLLKERSENLKEKMDELHKEIDNAKNTMNAISTLITLISDIKIMMLGIGLSILVE